MLERIKDSISQPVVVNLKDNPNNALRLELRSLKESFVKTLKKRQSRRAAKTEKARSMCNRREYQSQPMTSTILLRRYASASTSSFTVSRLPSSSTLTTTSTTASPTPIPPVAVEPALDGMNVRKPKNPLQIPRTASHLVHLFPTDSFPIAPP